MIHSLVVTGYFFPLTFTFFLPVFLSVLLWLVSALAFILYLFFVYQFFCNIIALQYLAYPWMSQWSLCNDLLTDPHLQTWSSQSILDLHNVILINLSDWKLQISVILDGWKSKDYAFKDVLHPLSQILCCYITVRFP